MGPIGTGPERSAGMEDRLSRVQDEVLEADAVEEGPADGEELEEAVVRPLPEPAPARAIDPWREDVRTVAIAAAGGIAAGAATVAVVGAVRSRVARGRPRRSIRRGGKDQGVLASRSFLIDVHVLGR